MVRWLGVVVRLTLPVLSHCVHVAEADVSHNLAGNIGIVGTIAAVIGVGFQAGFMFFGAFFVRFQFVDAIEPSRVSTIPVDASCVLNPSPLMRTVFWITPLTL